MVEVDLHLHTTCSDGTLTPAQLVRLCAGRGLKVVAITDHDSTEGIAEALEAAREIDDLAIISGIELSTDLSNRELHLLGYFVDHDDPSFQRLLRGFRKRREERGHRMVQNLNSLGVAITWERVRELSGGGAVGRPHVARAMVEAGYVRFPKEAFDKYIGRNGPAYVRRSRLTPVEAVRMLADSGSLPVLAHPTFTMDGAGLEAETALRRTLLDLKDAGLVGMEVHYKDYTPEQVAMLGKVADDLALIPCGGSDYHASGNPGEPEPGSVGPPMRTVKALEALRRTTRAPRC